MDIEYPTHYEPFVQGTSLISLKLDFSTSETESTPASILTSISNQLEARISSQIQCLSLNLSNCKLSTAELTQICDFVFPRLSNLTSLTLDVSQNSIGDAGYDVVGRHIARLTTLNVLSLNFDQTFLRHRGITMIGLLTYLPNLTAFSLSVNRNPIDLDTELRTVLPQFKDTSVFSKLRIFEIAFSECTPATQPSHQNSTTASSQKQQTSNIQATLTSNIQHLQTLQGYLHQLRANNYPDSHPQTQQCLQQLAATQANIAKLQSTPISTKKTPLAKLLELMLRFTISLTKFKLSCPGEIVTSALLEQFAQFLKYKQQQSPSTNDSLRSFEFSALDGVQLDSPNAADYFFFELGKLTQLEHLSITLVNLKTPKPLQLARFLSPLASLKSLEVNLRRLHYLSPETAVFEDIAGLLSSSSSNSLSKTLQAISLDVSSSQISTESIEAIAKSLAKYEKLTDVKLNCANCLNLTDRAVNAINEFFFASTSKLEGSTASINSAVIQIAQQQQQQPPNQAAKLQKIYVDLSSNQNISTYSIENMLHVITANKQTLTSLVLHAPVKRIQNNNNNNNNENRTSGNINPATLKEVLAQLTNLNKCIVSAGVASQSISNAFKGKAQLTERLIRQSECIRSNAQLAQSFRKEITFDLLQFFLP